MYQIPFILKSMWFIKNKIIIVQGTRLSPSINPGHPSNFVKKLIYL